MANTFSQAAFCQLVQRDELDCLEIRHPLFQADLLLQGAQLIGYSPLTSGTSEQWIWLSDEVKYKRGTSLRGGIPICWPWFGDADKNPQAVQNCMSANAKLPAHGFARSTDWTIALLKEDVHKIEVTLGLDTSASIPSLWKTPMALEAHFQFTGQGFTLSLTTTNQGNEDVCFSQALHTYFPTKDIHSTQIQGLEKSRYYDCLDSWKEKIQSGSIYFCGETDRVYQDVTGPLRLVTPEHTRQIGFQGSSSAIVWNPWIEKAKRLSQFNNADWTTMFCVETANAMDDVVALKPGESHQLVLSVEGS